MTEFDPDRFHDAMVDTNPVLVDETAATLRATGEYGSEAGDVAMHVLAALAVNGRIVR